MHRIDLLKKELQLAAKDLDLDQVVALDQELSAGSWSVKVPTGLLEAARAAHVQLRQRSARAEMEPLCQELSDAYAAFDRAKAVQLQKRFIALTEILDLDETDPFYDIAGPAFDWLNEEEAKATTEAEFAEGTSQLEAALERTTTISELETLYHQAVRHGHTLPELLENRLADRIESLKSAASRKRVMVLTSIVGVCLVSIVMVVMVVRRVTFQSAVAGHAQQLHLLLKNAVAAGDLKTVDEYMTSITSEDPRYMEQPEILGLTQKVELARQQETGRQSRLNQLIADALKLGVEEAGFENFRLAGQSLKDADAIARNDAEKSRILNARSEIQHVRAGLQQKNDEAFAADQSVIEDQIATLPADSVTEYVSVLSQMAELSQRDNVSAEMKAALNSLIAEVQRQQAVVQANLDIARDLQQVTNAIDNPTVYRLALLDYTKLHPGTARSEDFQVVIKSDLPLWEGVEQWRSLRQQFSDLDLSSVTPESSKILVTEFDSFQKTSRPYLGDTEVDERLAALRSIAERVYGAQGSSIQQVDRMFAPRTVSDAYLVTTRDGRKYYATGVPDITASIVSFRYFTTTTGTQTDEEKLGPQKISGDLKRPAERWRAPQTIICQELQPELKRLIEVDFEGAFLFAIEKLLQTDVSMDMDPILKFLLIEKLLKTGSEGSLFLDECMAPYLESIAAAGVSRLTNWALPGDDRAKDERIRATRYLDTNGPDILQALRQAKDDRTKATNRPIRPARECVGWLHRDAEANWVVTLRDPITVDKQTELLALGHIDGGAKFYAVTTISGDVIGTIPGASVTFGKEGHLVYRAESIQPVAAQLSSVGPIATQHFHGSAK